MSGKGGGSDLGVPPRSLPSLDMEREKGERRAGEVDGAVGELEGDSEGSGEMEVDRLGQVVSGVREVENGDCDCGKEAW